MLDAPAIDDILAPQLRQGGLLAVGTPIINIHSHVGPYLVHNPKMFGVEHMVEVMDQTGVARSCIFSHRAVAAFGALKLIWGSDFPFIGQPNQMAKVACAKITFEDKSKLLSLNALKILGEER